jgi:hypothetical protein
MSTQKSFENVLETCKHFTTLNDKDQLKCWSLSSLSEYIIMGGFASLLMTWVKLVHVYQDVFTQVKLITLYPT